MQREQVQEWAESPVNEALIELIKTYIKNMTQEDFYHPFEPYKTQESLAIRSGVIDTWEEVIEVLEGDWAILESEDEQ